MQCPIVEDANDTCFDCESPDFLLTNSCDMRRILNVSRFCMTSKDEELWLRYIAVRIACENGTIVVATNFTSHIRIIASSLATRIDKNCRDRLLERPYKCLSLNESVKQLSFSEFDGMDDVQFVSIIAIPLLFGGGARTMHAITWRRMIAVIETHVADRQGFFAWMTTMDYMTFVIAGCAIWLVAGFSIGIVIGCVGARTRTTKVTMNDFAAKESFSIDGQFASPLGASAHLP